MKSLQKILIPTDVSPFSLAATSWLITTPMFDAADLYILHVINDPVLMPPYPNVDLNAETIFHDSEKKPLEELGFWIGKNMSATRRVTPIVRRGDVARPIIACAAEEHADMSVIATHDRTGFAHMLFGSVAEKIV